jgi:hypothetical protein
VADSQVGWVPDNVDVSLPNSARMYDYLLGGGHNFAVDREMAERGEALVPGARELARVNRSFLRRAVQFLISQGVRQFLDLGSGIPTAGNVHEIAHEIDPRARVVYVDREPVAVAHTMRLLADNERACMVKADLGSPYAVLRAPQTNQLLDFGEPIGLLMVSVLHWVSDERRPGEIIATYRDSLPSGSFLALSHLTADFRPEQIAASVKLAEHSAERLHPRSKDEITELTAGFDLVDPGVVSAPHWRPDPTQPPAADADPVDYLAAVGRKP